MKRVFIFITCHFWAILLSYLAMPSFVLASDTIRVRYPGTASDAGRSAYTIELLKLALSHSDKHYQVVPSDIVSPKTRNFKLMEKNQGIDVVWSMTRQERESRFLPIRIPIFKGLSGWRIPLVHKDNLHLMKSIETEEQLKALSLGQMHAWTDAIILAQNGYAVVSGPNYESMFRMLSAKRFDYFPRSIVEALNEYQIHRENDIVIDPHIVIHYPSAMYFFVNKNDRELAQDIESGLEILIYNGMFDKLFYHHHKASLELSNFQNRRIFHLKNPLLPPETPTDRAELWLNPEYEL